METLADVLLLGDVRRRNRRLRSELANHRRFASEVSRFRTILCDVGLPISEVTYSGSVSFVRFVVYGGSPYLSLNIRIKGRGRVVSVECVGQDLVLSSIDDPWKCRQFDGSRMSRVRNYGSLVGSTVTIVDTATMFSSGRMLESSFERTAAEERTIRRFVDLGVQTGAKWYD